MFVQSTLECGYSPDRINKIIKKAWKPGFRLIGNDSDHYLHGSRQLADVLGCFDIDDIHEIVVQFIIISGIKSGLIRTDLRGGHTVAYDY